MPDQEKSDHEVAAERILAKLPKAVRDEAEVEAESGSYSLLKHGGRTVASVRAKNARITFAHDGSADQLATLLKVVAVAAESRRKASAAKEGDAS